jgi:lysophospholipase L1-like esterase
MKVLVITDSLGLPREKPQRVTYNETWVYKLKENFELHQLSLGGGILEDFIQQLEYIKMFEPDIVIVQIGIVDCVPRALSKLENMFLNRYGLTRKITTLFLPKYIGFLRKKRQISYTTESDFFKLNVKLKTSFNNNVFCLGILKPSKLYEKQVYGVKEKVNKYNSVLRKIYLNRFIDLSEIGENMIMTDHIHLTKKGHEFIFDKIKEKLNLIKRN